MIFSFRKLLVMVLLANSCSLFAQEISKFGAPFLLISPYARQVAMGEAFAALAMESNALRYNPAGLGHQQHITLSTHFHNWIDDTEQGALEAAFPTRFGALGLGLSYFNEGEIEVVNEQFVEVGEVIGNHDFLFSVGYGIGFPVFKHRLAFGAAARFVWQNLAEEIGNGIGLDAGMLYDLKYVALGATIQNLTAKRMKFVSEEHLFPEMVRGGLALRLPLGSRFKWNTGAEALHFLNTTSDEVRYQAGTEFRISEVIALRGGYKFNESELSDWSAGMGVIIPMLWLGHARTEFDYAYSPMEVFDSQAHRFSLTLNFGAVEEPLLARQDSEELRLMQERVAAEMEAAARARQEAEEARLAARETEQRLKDLEKEMAARLDSVMKIAATTAGKIRVQPEEGKILMTLRINFDFDKYDIRPSEYPTMNKVAEILDLYPDSKVGISGHTDNIGTDEYNFDLSEARMNSVMSFLANRGIASTRLFMPVPYGEWRHLTDNSTEEQRALNRRVEFILYTGEQPPVIPVASKIEGITVLGDSVVAIVGNGSLTDFTVEFIDGPPRMILKFPRVYISGTQNLPIQRGAFIRGRIAYHPEESSTWVVFDLQNFIEAEWVPQGRFLILYLP